MMEHLDPSGPMALVIMPASSVLELQTKQALIVSAKEPSAMVEALGPQPTEDGGMTAMVMGEPVHVATLDGRAILAGSAAIAKRLAKVEKSIDRKFTKSERAGVDGLDLAIWINGAGAAGSVPDLSGPTHAGKDRDHNPSCSATIPKPDFAFRIAGARIREPVVSQGICSLPGRSIGSNWSWDGLQRHP